jgi:hypothetical protein
VVLARVTPNKDFSAICKKCKLVFNFDSSGLGESGIEGVPTLMGYAPIGRYFKYDALTFPKADLSEVDATCGHCKTRTTFAYDDLLLPPNAQKALDEDRQTTQRLKRLENEINELKSGKKKLEGELDEAYQTITQKDADISKFAEAFFQLGKRLAKGDSPDQADSQKKQSEKKATYEGTNV